MARKPQTKEYKKVLMSKWRRKNPIKYLLQKIKSKAKANNLEFNLELDDLEIPTHCPVLDIPISQFNGRFAPNTLSIDRIDNTKGYIKGNVAIISLRANKLKSNMSFKEVEALYNYMKSYDVW